MIKKSQTVTANSEITPEASSRMIKLIEQTGIRGIVPDVVKAIMRKNTHKDFNVYPA
jgi:hypothetical protein